MSEDKPADTVESAPAEVNAIPNGKGHEPGEEITASAKTPPAGDSEKWVIQLNTAYVDLLEIPLWLTDVVIASSVWESASFERL